MKNDCIEWPGYKNKCGYGVKWFNGRPWIASRYVFLQKTGIDPGKKCVLHKCDNPSCVNIDHLYLGDQKQNAADRSARNRWKNQNVNKQYCKNGHKFDKENTYVRPSGIRVCKACQRRRMREHRKRKNN